MVSVVEVLELLGGRLRGCTLCRRVRERGGRESQQLMRAGCGMRITTRAGACGSAARGVGGREERVLFCSTTLVIWSNLCCESDEVAMLEVMNDRTLAPTHHAPQCTTLNRCSRAGRTSSCSHTFLAPPPMRTSLEPRRRKTNYTHLACSFLLLFSSTDPLLSRPSFEPRY